MIEIVSDTQYHLTTFKCTGEITLQEILGAIASFYDETPTNYVLWDLTLARVPSITADQVRQVVDMVKQLGANREGGKTAIVLTSDHDFGLGRLYETLIDLKGHTFETRVFHSLDEAKIWLLPNGET
jgi:hypothetical protein